MEVIDFDQKEIVEAKVLDTEKMGYILDSIIRSLKAGVPIKYNSFLKVIKESKNSVAIEAVKNLGRLAISVAMYIANMCIAYIAPPILTTTELSHAQDIAGRLL